MKTKSIISLGLLAVFILSGCVQQIRPSLRTHLGTERIFDKNYNLNQKLVAYVGQPIVKVKDYRVKKFKAKHMKASEDFTISGGLVTIQGDKNTDYRVRGETTIDKKSYTVVNVPGSYRGAGFGVLVKPDGSVHSQLLNDNIVMYYTFKHVPENLKFIASQEEEIDVGAGYLNYELVYGGTDGKSITITYREYTSKDLARPSFFQNVVYETGKKQIRFRDTILQIHEVTNEKIVYTVISDGLTR
uniref:hypothetical protein n=1 Tax=Candidatus Thiodubiliella endoseptemdiera TaxID=2738886 RepID=UPI0034DFDA30